MCGVLNERSGIVNIGIEGMMLTAAFVGFMVAIVVDEAIPDAQARDLRVHARLTRRRARGDRGGMLVSVLHAWLSISVRADQIISGTVINIAIAGLTSYLNRLIRPSGAPGRSRHSTRPKRSSTCRSSAGSSTCSCRRVRSRCP